MPSRKSTGLWGTARLRGCVSGHHSFGLAPEIGCAGSEEEGFYLGRQAGNSGLGRFEGTCNQLSFLSSDGGFGLLLSNFSAVPGSCHVPVDTTGKRYVPLGTNFCWRHSYGEVATSRCVLRCERMHVGNC